MTRKAKTERRRLVARRVFEALCAQYPEKYIALVQPGDATDQQIVHVTPAQSPGQQHQLLFDVVASAMGWRSRIMKHRVARRRKTADRGSTA
jgi:hypothetical protein